MIMKMPENLRVNAYVPFVDLSLILMSWLLLATLKMKDFQGIEVELPQVGTRLSVEVSAPDRVGIDDQGRWFYNSEYQSRELILSHIKRSKGEEFKVSISSLVSYGDAAILLAALAEENCTVILEMKETSN
jgi:biopolymer transport protein ExbD